LPCPYHTGEQGKKQARSQDKRIGIFILLILGASRPGAGLIATGALGAALFGLTLPLAIDETKKGARHLFALEFLTRLFYMCNTANRGPLRSAGLCAAALPCGNALAWYQAKCRGFGV
jgi:hypothetical protein